MAVGSCSGRAAPGTCSARTRAALETRIDLWILPVAADGKPEAGAKPRPYVRGRFDERGGRFSPEPNPRWVAYTSDESGHNEVYVQAFPEPRGKWQISAGGGASPEWDPGGHELFYLAPGAKLMAVKLKMGVDSVEPSVPRELFSLPGEGPSSGAPVDGAYRVAHDGKRFLVRTPVERGGQPLQVMVNWLAPLQKGASVE